MRKQLFVSVSFVWSAAVFPHQRAAQLCSDSMTPFTYRGSDGSVPYATRIGADEAKLLQVLSELRKLRETMAPTIGAKSGT